MESMLKMRKPVEFGKDIKAAQVDWKNILRDREQSFLTDNQLSVFFDRKNPGCERTHFYPLPFPHQFTGGKWDGTELMNHDSLRSNGPKLDFESQKTTMDFCPHQLTKTMKAGKSRIVERSCVSGNVLLIEWTVSGLDSVDLTWSLPYFDAKVKEFDHGVCVSVKNQAYAALVVSGVKEVVFEIQEQPLGCKAALTLVPGKVHLALACGYEEAGVINASKKAIKNPQGHFAAAEKTWDNYFRRIVPRFECSDSSSCSYHSLTGKYNQGKHELASQGAILTDLICKYLIGLNPRPGGKFDLNPVALSASGIKSFTFGPYLYCGKLITVAYDKAKGFKVTERAKANSKTSPTVP